MDIKIKSYLGDSVYIELDQYSNELILTTENGYGPTNRIALEKQVYNNLLDFVKSIPDKIRQIETYKEQKEKL